MGINGSFFQQSTGYVCLIALEQRLNALKSVYPNFCAFLGFGLSVFVLFSGTFSDLK